MDTSLKDWVILGLAAYAAIVSTCVGIWTIIGVSRDRASVKVRVRFGYVSSGVRGAWIMSLTGFNPAQADQTNRLIIEATNIGRRPVTLNAGGLLYRDGTFGAFTGDGWDKTYPITLDEGKSGSTWTLLFHYRDSNMQDRLKNPPTRAMFRSESGKLYKARLSKEFRKALLPAKS